MKELLRTKKVRMTLIALAAAAVLLLTFALGIAIGYHRAIFASRFGENYYRNFYGAPRGFMHDPMGRMPVSMHGAVGTVLDVSSTSISLVDRGNNEWAIEISPDTVFRKGDATVGFAAVRAGDGIAVIGAPGDNGTIRARFVRIFPVPPSATSSAIQQ